jgi:arrestin-related trafficking adapter 1
MEFPFSVRADSRPQCDVKAGDGTEVSHTLVIEMIIAEEVAPIARPTHATSTGAARVLRMNFNIILTERSGMGVSWDEEQPPLYENVPESPPGYGRTEVSDYVGAPIPDYEELETLRD